MIQFLAQQKVIVTYTKLLEKIKLKSKNFYSKITLKILKNK